VSPKSELGFLYAFDSVVHQELWIYGFQCQIGSGEQRQALKDKQRKKALEEKMDNVIWKMNLIIVDVVCVVFGCLLGMHAAKK
jgi:hypothetical protein